jgi:hypothetical protein
MPLPAQPAVRLCKAERVHAEHSCPTRAVLLGAFGARLGTLARALALLLSELDLRAWWWRLRWRARAQRRKRHQKQTQDAPEQNQQANGERRTLPSSTEQIFLLGLKTETRVNRRRGSAEERAVQEIQPPARARLPTARNLRDIVCGGRCVAFSRRGADAGVRDAARGNVFRPRSGGLDLRCSDFYDRSGLSRSGRGADREYETGDQHAELAQQEPRKSLQARAR